MEKNILVSGVKVNSMAKAYISLLKEKRSMVNGRWENE